MKISVFIFLHIFAFFLYTCSLAAPIPTLSALQLGRNILENEQRQANAPYVPAVQQPASSSSTGPSWESKGKWTEGPMRQYNEPKPPVVFPPAPAIRRLPPVPATAPPRPATPHAEQRPATPHVEQRPPTPLAEQRPPTPHVEQRPATPAPAHKQAPDRRRHPVTNVVVDRPVGPRDPNPAPPRKQVNAQPPPVSKVEPVPVSQHQQQAPAAQQSDQHRRGRTLSRPQAHPMGPRTPSTAAKDRQRVQSPPPPVPAIPHSTQETHPPPPQAPARVATPPPPQQQPPSSAAQVHGLNQRSTKPSGGPVGPRARPGRQLKRPGQP